LGGGRGGREGGKGERKGIGGGSEGRGSEGREEATPPNIFCSFCVIAAAVPPRPQDGTVSVIVLFTIVSSCVTDCNF